MNNQKTLPPFWFLVAIISMMGLHWFFPGKQIVNPPVSYGGIVGIIIGFFIILYCAFIFRKKETTIKPFEESSYLVQEGFFSYSRNPIYLGMIIFLLGLWLILGNITSIIVIPIFFWIIQEKFIKQEEKMLEDTFGEQYQQYQAKVRRWI